MSNYLHNASRFEGIATIQQHPFLSMDLARMVCGEKIGSGQYRDVYEYKLHRGYVVKVTHYQEYNWNEYNVWEAVKDAPYSKWFAPVVDISPGGHFLIMKKVKPIPDKFKLPKTIPQFFTDLKRENFGVLNGRLVAIDYQFILRGLDVCFNCSPQKLVFK